MLTGGKSGGREKWLTELNSQADRRNPDHVVPID